MATSIRKGCYIEWEYRNKEYSGVVHNHYYTEEGHVFFVRLENGSFYKTSGAFLYTNVTYHIQGKESRKQQKKTKKRYLKRKKKESRKIKSSYRANKRKLKFYEESRNNLDKYNNFQDF